MSKEREAEIRERLESYKQGEAISLVKELLTDRRERYRNRLEKEESNKTRGRSLECKDLLQILS